MSDTSTVMLIHLREIMLKKLFEKSSTCVLNS